MKRELVTTVLCAALMVSGCASTGTVTRVNGVPVTEKSTSSPDRALLTFGLIGAAVILGVALTKNDGDGENPNRRDQFEECIRAGFPEPYCRSLVT